MPRSPVAAFALLSLAAAATLVVWEPCARADNPIGLRVEATVGGGWRTSIDANDRNPGFDTYGAQGEVAIGAGYGPFALLVGGLGRFGSVRNAAYFQDDPTAVRHFPTYWEATGNLGFQLNLGERVRARIGGSGGVLHVIDHAAPVAGGFLSVSFDATTFKAGRLAILVALRLDLDKVLGDDQRLPNVSTSLGAGVGVRY